MKPFALSLMVVILSAARKVDANVTVNPMPSGVTKTQVAGKWRIDINRAPNLSEIYTIEGDAGDTIEWIRVTQNGVQASSLSLFVRGKAGTPGLFAVEEIDRVGGGSGQLWILELNVTHNVGLQGIVPGKRLRAAIIEHVTVGGDSFARWGTFPRPSGQQSRIDDVVINGNVYEDIVNDNGFIGAVTVVGSMVGIQSDPMLFSVRETVRRLWPWAGWSLRRLGASFSRGT